jgi:hypothetical protein
MSIELQARFTTAERLVVVLAHAERYLGGVPHDPLVVEAKIPSSEIVIGPFPPDEVERDGRRYKDPFSMWALDFVYVSTGRIARVCLTVGYRPPVDEMDHGSYELTEDDRRESEATSGYWLMLDAGVYRTKASFCLASLVACAVAERNHSLILDESDDLKLGRFADPSALRERFSKHSQATSFEAFADAFCHEIDFASNWPDSVEELDALSR